MNESAARFVSDHGEDDSVLPFAVEPLDVRGRVVKLGPALDHILSQHGYPAPIARLLGEAVVLTVLLGSSLKIEGRFQLQTRSDGVVDMLVVDFDAPDRLRAFARYDAQRLAFADRETDLIGKGHLAFTIDPGNEMSRYQGIVAMEGQGLEEAAHQYFRQSEQIPTFVRLAVAEAVTGSGDSQATAWRAGGIMLQFLPTSPERQRQADFDPGDIPEGYESAEGAAQGEDAQEDEAWSEAKILAGTIEDHELVDPTLSSERLLYRLFHERGVKVFAPQTVHDSCRCSREGIARMLRNFTPQERQDMIGDNGKIGVTCEFCSTFREFEPEELETAPEEE
ncbi:Hsp33 family molecular chaperone [Beijerinckia mobilis]|uniref:Hsp33 family molecular chaperone n=1 Tax=Beijerinckia mobilis TaxID=231434 RepID=UPI000551E40A|nr:Hsp33 family molecular chaperone [Beijerinckia mobilis]